MCPDWGSLRVGSGAAHENPLLKPMRFASPVHDWRREALRSLRGERHAVADRLDRLGPLHELYDAGVYVVVSTNNTDLILRDHLPKDGTAFRDCRYGQFDIAERDLLDKS